LFSRIWIVAGFAVAALVIPGVSAAAKSPSGTGGCGSACDQYTEQLPTSDGSQAVGVGKTNTAGLSRETENALASADSNMRAKLREIVTSSSATKTPRVDDPGSSLGRSLLAPVVSPGDGSTGRLVILLAEIVGTIAVVGVIAIRKQRVSR
jgi:hypothetical protein